MSWMDTWSRPKKSAPTPPPLYLTASSPVPYCHTCGRVISERKKPGSEVKYCSARCRHTKPGPTDRRIEGVFAALLDGKAVEGGGKDKTKKAKGDQRVIVECQTVQDVVFKREKDPEKVHGRRKNRRPRGVIEKDGEWRSVDMLDQTEPEYTSTKTTATRRPPSLTSEEESTDEDGGIPITLPDPKSTCPASTSTDPSTLLPDTLEYRRYGYASGKIRPPQSLNAVNGSVGGEIGRAERVPETASQRALRLDGQQRAEERERVRRAARRGCAFGFVTGGKEDVGGGERRKCEAVMKGVVVESSFAKGEWGVRWREEV